MLGKEDLYHSNITFRIRTGRVPRVKLFRLDSLSINLLSLTILSVTQKWVKKRFVPKSKKFEETS